MTESTQLWNTVRTHLGPYGRFTRIENRCHKGTPDVAYTLQHQISGWIELKMVREAPARSETKVKIDHLTLEQVRWLQTEHAAGGRAWLILRIEKLYALLNPALALLLHNHALTYNDIKGSASVATESDFPTKAILQCLMR